MDPTQNIQLTPEILMLRNNRDDGYNYRYRRSLDWTENYELYRDKVIVNRLTQRQSVNLPLMKGQIRSLLKDVDDMPVIYFENLDNDKQAELFKNEYWKWTVEYNKMELQDIVDKRQVFLFGRSFDQWQIADGKVKMTVQDPEDILISRYCNPFDLHSSRYLIHLNIFVPLSSLSKNKDYDQKEVAELQKYFSTRLGLVKANENEKQLVEKNQKMRDMGVPDVDDPRLGETYVELALHFVYRDNEVEDALDKKGNAIKKEIPTQIYLYVLAENNRTLMKKPLEQVIGMTKDHFWRNHFPYNSWADDLERQDFWSDAVADIIRTPNKVLNSWFSQLVENRTLRNFGMHYYNSNLEGFNPQTMQPIPWGWYGIPIPPNGNLDAVMKKVDVPDLSESLDEMNFLISITEKASGATSTQQGAQAERQITLGEIKFALTEAKERIKGMSKFYTPVWKDRGLMFIKLLEAAPDKLDAVMIYKKGRNTTDVYSREVSPKDWQTPLGYRVRIWSQDEKDSTDLNGLQKQNAVKAAMPNNPKVAEIYNRKLLEWANYKPDEVNEIMQVEEERMKNATQAPPKESIAIAYKDAPPDIQRQMEIAAGFKPSTMGTTPVAPVTGGTPTPPGPGGQPTPPVQPTATQPLLPSPGATAKPMGA